MNKHVIGGGLMDATLADLIIAFKEAGGLYKSSKSPNVRRSARSIQTQIRLSLNQLCPLGVHAGKWFDEESQKSGIL